MSGRVLRILPLLLGCAVPALAQEAPQRIGKLPCADISAGAMQGAAPFGIPLAQWSDPLLDLLKLRAAECAASARRAAERADENRQADNKARDERLRAAEDRVRAARAAADKAEADLAAAREAIRKVSAGGDERRRAEAARLASEEEALSKLHASFRDRAQAERQVAAARVAELKAREAEAAARRQEAERLAALAREAEAKARTEAEAARRATELPPAQRDAIEARKRIEARLELLERQARGGSRPVPATGRP
ncbi:MAG: hypothetical protein JWR08_777 [Enterovirga sp.]|nr:hypothetical protein [Enterovirga sp.]